jgi:hypothetical protein
MPEAEQGGVAGGGIEHLPRLSYREGGLANVKSYCRCYLKRPLRLCNMCICSGGGCRPPCVDLFWCLGKPFKEKDPESFDEGEEDRDVLREH